MVRGIPLLDSPEVNAAEPDFVLYHHDLVERLHDAGQEQVVNRPSRSILPDAPQDIRPQPPQLWGKNSWYRAW
jgi:hypothetical protein